MNAFTARTSRSSMRARSAESVAAVRPDEQERDETHLRMVLADPATWARIYL